MDSAFPGLDDESTEDALGVLADVASWRLTDGRWSTVTALLTALLDAVEDADVDAFRAATIQLELASPTRITRIGAEPAVPPPAPVLEIANSVVHRLLPQDGRTHDGEPVDDRPTD
ncbi:CATRA system-associated protein [Actinosynnema sp. CA-299493]